MASDPKHAQVFARVEAIWQEPWDTLRSSRATAKVLRTVERHRVARRIAFPMVAGILLMIGAGAGLIVSSERTSRWSEPGSSTVFQTKPGENRAVDLSDGSRAVLGGRTELRVAFDDTARRIELSHGEAYFTVAKDPQRPFSVRAGDATVTAIGTQFNVRRRSDRVMIAVVEGGVVVEPSPPSGLAAWIKSTQSQQIRTRLSAGEQTLIDESGVRAATSLIDAGTATAWQHGQLEFREEPLRYVLEDVNRYSAKPIVFQDHRIGEVRITGTVLNDNIRGWIKGLESAFALRAEEQEEKIVLRLR